MPVDTVDSRPRGLPITTMSWPSDGTISLKFKNGVLASGIFTTSLTISASAFLAMMPSTGYSMPDEYGGTSLGLAGTVPAANSLRCAVDGLEIELGGYLWSQPSCAELDTVSPFDWSPDGGNDFSGVYLLLVTEVPRLSILADQKQTPPSLPGRRPPPVTSSNRALALPASSWSSVTNTPADDGNSRASHCPSNRGPSSSD